MMPRRRLSLALLTLALGSLAAGLGSASPADVGAVAKVQARAEATQNATTRALAVAAPVYFGDRLQTGPGARLEARLADDTVLTLGQNGRLTVDDFVYHPGATGNTLALRVTRGAFLFVGGKIEGPSGGNVSITTPVATLGVRGTTVWGGPIDHGYGVLVLKGLVTVTTAKGSVTLHPGEGTMIYGSKPPADAAPWPQHRTKQALASIAFQHAQ